MRIASPGPSGRVANPPAAIVATTFSRGGSLAAFFDSFYVIVEPTLRWTFVKRGYALVHGACIAADGEAQLITARTDTEDVVRGFAVGGRSGFCSCGHV